MAHSFLSLVHLPDLVLLKKLQNLDLRELLLPVNRTCRQLYHTIKSNSKLWRHTEYRTTIMYGIFFLINFIFIEYGNSYTGDDVARLYRDLFSNYDRRVRPVKDQNNTLYIYVEYSLQALIEFNEKSQTLSASGWFKIFWIDEYLMWNSTKYFGVDKLKVFHDDIWHPEVLLTNPAEKLKPLGQSSVKADVFQDGLVLWFLGDLNEVPCNIDVSYFPFDTQNCSLYFTIWSTNAKEATFRAVRNTSEVITNEFVRHNEWNLVQNKMTVEGTVLIITFILQRRPSFILLTLVIPIILLSFLNIFVFLVPVESGEKNSFVITIYLSYAVFLESISSTLPHNAVNISYLTEYLIFLLALSVIIVLFTVIEVRIYHLCGEKVVPVCIRRCVTIFCRQQINSSEVFDKTSINSAYGENTDVGNFDAKCDNTKRPNIPAQIVWKDIISSLDIVLFVSFLFVTIIANVILFIVLLDSRTKINDVG